MNKEPPQQALRVGIVMGSDSDWETLREAVEMCQHFAVPCEARVVSAHRTPHDMLRYAETAIERGIQVIIAGAGGAAHLPGMLASVTILPVIGVPIMSRLQGWDSLLSIVQMPAGVPVATVAVGAARNAAILAVEILALSDPALGARLHTYKSRLAEDSRSKRLEESGKGESSDSHVRGAPF